MLTPNKRIVPTRLSLEKDGLECKNYDVYFNNVKQSRCLIVDATTGYIKRFKVQIFGIPLRDKAGKFVTEELHGKVEIYAKGNQS